MMQKTSAKLALVTFTGADDSTTSEEISAIVTAAHTARIKVEIACLLDFELSRSPRYPDPVKAYTLLRHARSVGADSIALHICGTAADMLLDGYFGRDTWGDSLQPLAYVATMGRIQVNAPAARISPESLIAVRHALHKRGGYHPIIIGQSRDSQGWPEDVDLGPGVELVMLGETFETRTRSIQYLYDCSGGRGVAPKSWPPLPHGRLVGLAGGLGPSTVADAFDTGWWKPVPKGNAALESVLAHINDAPEGVSCWIDMESGVREPVGSALSAFSPEKCVQVLEHPMLRMLSRP